MRVLLIWEENPENVDPYVIDNPTEEQLAVLEEANGFMMNGDEEVPPALFKLSDALCSNIEHCDPEGDPKWKAIWAGHLTQFPVEGPIAKVFKCGFYA